MKSVTLHQHRKRPPSKPDNGARYSSDKQKYRAVFGAAKNPISSPAKPVTLPTINALTLAEIEEKYGPARPRT